MDDPVIDIFDYSKDHYVRDKIKENTKEKNLVTELKGEEVTRKDKIYTDLIASEKRKSEIKQKAWEDLDNAFGKKVKCKDCNGTGISVDDDICPVCNGHKVVSEPNMRAVELVLSPEYPKTTVNLNASIDKMDTQSALDILERILG